MEASERIVITGIGIANALGVGVSEFWNNTVERETGIQTRNEWEVEGLGNEYFGTCDFTFKEHFEKLSLPFPLKYSQLAMLGCKLALNDAGLSQGDVPADRIGLIVNTSFGANAAVETYMLKLIQKGPARVSPVTFTKTVTNCALGDVARYFNLKGPSSMLIGENSLCYGIDLLNANKADVMICGGFDEVRDLIVKTYSDNGVLLSSKEGTALQERLLAEDEQGKVILGEGSAYVIIEQLSHALQRGARIYAEIMGYSTGCDGECNHFVFKRSSEDLRSVMANAIQEAGFNQSEVGLVVGSACLPWQVKSYEVEAIANIWDESRVHYTTVKSKIGETFGSSDLASLAVGALSLKYDVVPGTGLPAQLFKDAPVNVAIAEKASRVPLKEVAVVNSIHIGGNTTSVILKKFSH